MKNRRLFLTTGVAALALGSAGFCIAQQAPDGSKFVGTWKENPAKRTLGAQPPLRFQAAANGGLEELRGPEVRPLVQPVQFGAKAYSVDKSSNMIEWKKVDSNHFERRLYESGKLLSTRKIEVSKDGSTLTEVTERSPSDIRTAVFKRNTSGGQGLAGVWKAESMRGTPEQIKIERLGAQGVRVTSDRGMIRTLTFDGKSNPVAGPAVLSGTADAAKLKSPDTIEVAMSREGVASNTVTLVLSADGRTLTQTSKRNSDGQTSVTVFDKQ